MSETSLDNFVMTTTRTSVRVASVQTTVWVVLDPRQKPLVHLLCEYNVLHVVLLHSRPRLPVVLHAPEPQVESIVLKFRADTQLHSNVLQFVTGESEALFDYVQ